MMELPGLMVALTVNSYWSCVVVLAIARRRRQRVGLLPRKLQERIIWPIWGLVLLAWNVLPWSALFSHRAPWCLPELVRTDPMLQGMRAVAAGCAVICFGITLYCWLKMGRSWSLAVVPDQSAPLVQTGIYSLVRHPIYGLSMALMMCSVIVAPTWPMLAIGGIHVAILVLKARGEEEWLLSTHGQVYRAYMGRTGRFFPRLLRRSF